MKRPNPRIKVRHPHFRRSPRRRLMWILPTIIIAVVVTAMLLLYQPPETDSKTKADAALALRSGKIMPAEPSSPDPKPSAESKAEEARAVIDRLRSQPEGPDLDQAYARAEAFRDSGRTADAYLLYFFAARAGHLASMLRLGTQADPAYFSATDSLMDNPDPAQAYKWYRRASAAGAPEAEDQLQRLHEQVARAAAAGDEKAQRLLLQWQQ